VRVISGQAKGRPLKAVPGNTTRPTSDKVKEALFSIIGPYFDGEKVLDLFAGTGGLGIEALSRGAASAVFVDVNPRSVEVVRRNLEAAKLADRAEVFRIDGRKAIKLLERKGMAFDLVFLDPPYAVVDCDAVLRELAERGLVAHDAVAVIEHASDVSYSDEFTGYHRTRHPVYGETALSVYRYHAEGGKQTESFTAEEPEGGVSP
jgi:16S rRNA (guanine(966)-N(2))-methyltransferase RsmD